MNNNRCGAKGILEFNEGKIFFVVNELISKMDYEGGLKLVLEEDISIGERIPLGDLVYEHRGVVVYDGVKIYLDEGEFGRRRDTEEIIFVSDYDGPLAGAPASNLRILPYTFQVKPEIYDEVGAFRRLKQIKKAFQL